MTTIYSDLLASYGIAEDTTVSNAHVLGMCFSDPKHRADTYNYMTPLEHAMSYLVMAEMFARKGNVIDAEEASYYIFMELLKNRNKKLASDMAAAVMKNKETYEAVARGIIGACATYDCDTNGYTAVRLLEESSGRRVEELLKEAKMTRAATMIRTTLVILGNNDVQLAILLFLIYGAGLVDLVITLINWLAEK
ncbi:MAG: hypothetical protein LLG37_01665 [Spirochaetia bacterium]|nr:hypothetical protein [Spirochaetia bacterium]